MHCRFEHRELHGRGFTTLAAVAFFLLSTAACDGCRGGSNGTSDQRAAPWPLDARVARNVPNPVRAVVFVRRLRDLRRALDFGFRRLSPLSNSLSPLELSTDIRRLRTWGLAPDRSAALFVKDNYLGLVAPTRDSDRIVERLQNLSDAHPFEIERLADEGLWELRSGKISSDVVRFAVRNGRLLARTAPAHPPAGPSGAADIRQSFDRFFAADDPGGPHSKWPRDAPIDSFMKSVASRAGRTRAVAYSNPGAWIRDISTKGQAAIIQSRLANQLGPTAFRIGFEDSERKVWIDVHSRSVSGEPTVVQRMGSPSGKRPVLGGLVEPGVLGLLRISVQPESVYRFLKSTLPATRREQLDVFWGRVRKKLLIDGPEQLLDLFTGHVAVVFYGLEDRYLKNSGIESLRNVFELRATREAVLLPIKSRKKTERLLDQLTQITRGHLSRQRDEHTVQYIWMEDGVLKWALILGDDFLLFVDSATSLNKAKQYERHGRPLPDRHVETMHLGPLLEGRRRSGLYLDTVTLSKLLRDNGFPWIAGFLTPVRSMLLTTEKSGEMSRTRLHLYLNRP